jgi:hypothetical protein
MSTSPSVTMIKVTSTIAVMYLIVIYACGILYIGSTISLGLIAIGSTELPIANCTTTNPQHPQLVRRHICRVLINYNTAILYTVLYNTNHDFVLSMILYGGVD